MERDARVPAAILAELLGISDEQLKEILHTDGVEEDAGSVEWGDAATYLFDAWPRTRIFDALDAPLLERIPAGVRPAPIEWHIPPYIVRAIEHQARAHSPSTSIDDYVADVLFSEIEPKTIALFASDAALVEAFLYPFTR